MNRKIRSPLRLLAIFAVLLAGSGTVLYPGATALASVTGAAFTTTNTNIDGTGHCMNGKEDGNCNIYADKQYVWLSDGPSVAYVGDGTYFFAVLVPGGQADPNDGAANNL